jgi:threonine synthase
MIGNPVSMPRVIRLVEHYRKIAGEGSVRIIQISEQQIMDAMLFANRNGHIACTQGGECLAGLQQAVAENKVDRHRTAILDATAHALKFAGFQEKYFLDSFEPEFEVIPKTQLQNAPYPLTLPDSVPNPASQKLGPEQLQEFIKYTSSVIVEVLGLKEIKRGKA